MTLNMLKKGQVAIIEKIDASSALKERLFSFGIVKGEEIELKRHSLAKNTFEVRVGETLVALRKDEAKSIKVKVK